MNKTEKLKQKVRDIVGFLPKDSLTIDKILVKDQFVYVVRADNELVLIPAHDAEELVRMCKEFGRDAPEIPNATKYNL